MLTVTAKAMPAPRAATDIIARIAKTAQTGVVSRPPRRHSEDGHNRCGRDHRPGGQSPAAEVTRDSGRQYARQPRDNDEAPMPGHRSIRAAHLGGLIINEDVSRSRSATASDSRSSRLPTRPQGHRSSCALAITRIVQNVKLSSGSCADSAPMGAKIAQD